jgi:dihydrofolate synthase/folylpolyglutamate synthase
VNYPEAIAWLYGTQQHGIKPGLGNIRRLLEALDFSGHRQRFIHVAGTNGKGSVCAMIDSIARAGGLRTGLYTSPHLVSFRERIRIDGKMIPETDAARGLSKIADIIADWEEVPTFFEITTALALDFFQQENADVVALETGLGGRLDATNVVTPVASVITAIDLDHQAWLGSTLEEIALEKAGIIKPGVPVVSAPQQEAAIGILIRTAAEKNAPIEFVTAPLEKFPISLGGSHQKLNAALAVAALQAGGLTPQERAIRKGLANIPWPGRFQSIQTQNSTATDAQQRPGFQLKNLLLLDGAHNEAAARRLALTWREVFGEEKCVIILGILKDKDMAAICRELLPVAAAFVITPVHSQRTSQPEELLAMIRGFDPGTDCRIARDFTDALGIAGMRPEKILVTGSLFLVGEALAYFEGSESKPEMSLQ